MNCIKTTLSSVDPQAAVYSLLDEAKSMLEINKYHDNIVNLQGIAYERSNQNDGIIEVSFKNIF